MEITARVKKNIWVGEDGTTIASFELLDSKRVININEFPTDIEISKPFTGILKGIVNEKEVIKLKGSWKNTPKYGWRFNVTSIDNGLSEKENILYQFMCSNFVSGIDAKLGKLILDTFKEKTSVALSDVQMLKLVKGIGDKIATKISTSYNKNREYFNIFELTAGDISIGMIKKLKKVFGERTCDVLKENPYVITEHINGVGFRKADLIARKLGIDKNSDMRVLGGIMFSLDNDADMEGHTYLLMEQLEERLIELLFPINSLKEVFYEDILESKVPEDTSEWEKLVFANFDEKVIKRIITTWNDPYKKTGGTMSEKYINVYKMRAIDVDTIETYISMVNDLREKLPSLLIKLQNEDKIIIDDEKIASKELYLAEKSIAKYFSEIIKTNSVINSNYFNAATDKHIAEAIMEVEQKNGCALGDEQIQAVIESSCNPVSIITGGPGRGKTTIVNTVIKALKKAGNNKFLLVAPTGRAAQRMTESTGMEASTIHRIILNLKDECSMDISKGTVIIIDETSMVGVKLLAEFCALIKNNVLSDVMFILVGDIDQLPSIECGAVLKDLIASKVVPVTYLLKCYRNEGAIVNNVDSIRVGKLLCDFKWDKDFSITKIEDTEESFNTIPNKMLTLYKKAVEKYGDKEVAIITPQRKNGITASNQINAYIQENVNPIPKNVDKDDYEFVFEEKNISKRFRLNDRVMHIKNNYSILCDKPMSKNEKELLGYDENEVKYKKVFGCFNGETGKIVDINKTDETLTVEFDDGKIVVYSVECLEELELAYAITTHKSQGSEYSCVIVIQTKKDFIMLERELLYTAVSRGKKEVILLGMPKSFNMAITTQKGKVRQTRLDEFLVNYFS